VIEVEDETLDEEEKDDEDKIVLQVNVKR